MIRTTTRVKGGAPQLGTDRPGELGPFGVRADDGDQAEPTAPEPSDRDAELLAAVAAAAETRAADRIARFRERRRAAAERREQMWLARQRGLGQRNGQKLRQLGERGDDGPEAA